MKGMVAMNSPESGRFKRSLPVYKFALAGFIVFLAMSLLAVVDFRRGFLFSEYARSPYSAFHPAQPIILAIAAVGMFVCYRIVQPFEAGGLISPKYGRAFTFGCLSLLVIDLFVHRGVPAVRAIGSGTLRADWLQAFGVSGWLRPFALSTSYLLTVWHATMVGILIAGLAVTVLPLYLKSLFSRTGIMGTLTGALYAIPQPFCSCCAAVMVPSYARRGASTEFALSFVVGSPMLNITTIVLSFTLLPLPFAITRALAGVIFPTVATYFAWRLAERWNKNNLSVPSLLSPRGRRIMSGFLSAWSDRYTRLFKVDVLVEQSRLETVGAIVTAWCRASLSLAVVLVPTLFVWSVVTAGIVQLLPSAFGNNLTSVVLAAITGTLLMISTWTEIPVALQLIESGLTGPAATLLVVLPPLSLPCVMLLGGSLGRFGSVVVLAFAVMVSGIVAGIIFL
jgi:uncharacterized membrane protein YraQ (UPF0718 family)